MTRPTYERVIARIEACKEDTKNYQEATALQLNSLELIKDKLANLTNGEKPIKFKDDCISKLLDFFARDPNHKSKGEYLPGANFFERRTVSVAEDWKTTSPADIKEALSRLLAECDHEFGDGIYNEHTEEKVISEDKQSLASIKLYLEDKLDIRPDPAKEPKYFYIARLLEEGGYYPKYSDSKFFINMIDKLSSFKGIDNRILDFIKGSSDYSKTRMTAVALEWEFKKSPNNLLECLQRLKADFKHEKNAEAVWVINRNIIDLESPSKVEPQPRVELQLFPNFLVSTAATFAGITAALLINPLLMDTKASPHKPN